MEKFNLNKEKIGRTFRKISMAALMGVTSLASIGKVQGQEYQGINKSLYTTEAFNEKGWDKVHELNIQTLKDKIIEEGQKQGENTYIKSISYKDGEITYHVSCSVGKHIVLVTESIDENSKSRFVKVDIDMDADGVTEKEGNLLINPMDPDRFNPYADRKYEVEKGELNFVLESEDPLNALSETKDFNIIDANINPEHPTFEGISPATEKTEEEKFQFQNGFRLRVMNLLKEGFKLDQDYWNKRTEIRGVNETDDNSYLFPNIYEPGGIK